MTAQARRIKIRYLVPNSFTALSLLFGLFSIFFTLDQNLKLSAWIIIWCGLLDKLDGIAARLMKASSEFGVEFDSFADFVAFGLAPGFLIYQHALHMPSLPFLNFSQEGLIWFYRIAVAIYILCAGIRLATFNVRTSTLGPDWFYGFPSTYSGMLVASFLLTAENYDLLQQVVPWTPVVIVPLGLMMLTPLKLPKIKARKNRIVNLFQAAAGAFVVIFALLRMFPELLFGVAVAYLVGGLLIGLFSNKTPPVSVALAGEEPLPPLARRSPTRGSRGIWWWRKRRGSKPEIKHIEATDADPCAEKNSRKED